MSNELQNDEYYLPGNLGTITIGNQVREVKQVFAAKDGSVTITIGEVKQPLLIDGNETGLCYYLPEQQIELPAKSETNEQ